MWDRGFVAKLGYDVVGEDRVSLREMFLGF